MDVWSWGVCDKKTEASQCTPDSGIMIDNAD